MSNKHKTLCDYLLSRCAELNPIDTFKNLNYGLYQGGNIGEVDVWQVYETYEVSYEIKSTDSTKQRKKALDQLLRWSKYMKKREHHKNYYGVYFTPTYVKIMCKNGMIR